MRSPISRSWRVGHPLQEAPALVLGVEVHVLAGQHRPRCYANPLKLVHQVVLVGAGSPLTDDAVQFVMVFLPGKQAAKPCVGRQGFLPHQAGHGLPLLVAAHRQGNPLVLALGRVAALGGAGRMAVADASSLAPVGDAVHDVLRQEHGPRLVHPDVYPLAPSGAVAVAQRPADGEKRSPGRQEVHEGRPLPWPDPRRDTPLPSNGRGCPPES